MNCLVFFRSVLHEEKIHLYNTKTTVVKYIATQYSSQAFLPNCKHNLPDDSQLCRYKAVLDKSAPDLILARRKFKVDTTTTLETPRTWRKVWAMGMDISDGLPFYLFHFSHSNQTVNIGLLRILRSQQAYFLILRQSSSMGDKVEHSLQNRISVYI